MSNKHRKTKQKPTIDAFLRRKLGDIRAVLDPVCDITLIIGYPADPDSDVVLSTNVRHAQIVLARRADQVAASIEAGGRIERPAMLDAALAQKAGELP